MLPNMPQAKTVLVTGAAKRLGKAIAFDLAAHGWQIALHYHHSQQEAEETARELASLTGEAGVAVFQADLASADACRSLFAAVLLRFGSVQALVNSASQFEHDDVRQFRPELAQQHMAVNCVAPIVLAQCLHQHVEQMALQPGNAAASAAVVNLLDQKLWNLNPDFLSYTLSKAALQSATTMMAQALAPRVRVCGVAPGLSLPSYLQSPEDFERAHKVSPLGRSSKAEDVARTVRFVIENESMTGSQILVDGGQHLMHLPRDISFLK